MSLSLPEGWVISKLGDIVSSKKGKKPKQLTVEKLKNKVPYIDIRAFEKGDIRQYADIESSVLIDEEDILMVWDGARSGLVGSNISGALGSTLVKINSTDINKNYLFYFLKSKFHDINKNTKGTGIPHVNPKYLWDLDFPIPPLTEQKQIAKKLDKLLARVERIKTVLDNAPAKIKRFRQSVLASAVGGELTEGKNWKSLTINDCGAVTGGLTKNGKRKEYTLQYPYLRVANVYANELKLDEISEIGVKESELERTLLEENDLLIVEGNGSIEQIGRVALWTGEIKDCLHQNHLIKFRTDASKALPRYVLYWLLSPQGRTLIVDVAKSTTGLHTLSLTKVKNIQINIPNLEEQKAIVKKVETLFAIADKMEANLAEAQKRVNKLTQSILAKAFRGEL